MSYNDLEQTKGGRSGVNKKDKVTNDDLRKKSRVQDII